jgi:hypothetical protein
MRTRQSESKDVEYCQYGRLPLTTKYYSLRFWSICQWRSPPVEVVLFRYLHCCQLPRSEQTIELSMNYDTCRKPIPSLIALLPDDIFEETLALLVIHSRQSTILGFAML